MTNTFKTIATLVAGLVIALSLTACAPGTDTEPAPKPSTTQSTTKTPAPAPVETTPSDETPDAVKLEGTVVEKNAEGAFVLPSGETVTCDADAQAVIVNTDGTWTCDLGLDW